MRQTGPLVDNRWHSHGGNTMKNRGILLGRIILAALGCSAAALTGLAAATDQSSTVTFTKNVLPVLQRNCQSCHRPGQVAPMSLLTYQEARPWAKAIKAAVMAKKMPPWFADQNYGHFTNDRSLKQRDIDTLVQWADSGAAEGGPGDLPAPV